MSNSNHNPNPMKNLLFLLLFTLIQTTLPVHATTPEPPLAEALVPDPGKTAKDKQNIIPSKISDVTVFLSGAQVFREGSFSAPAGISQIVLDSVSSVLQPKSLQATAMGPFIILDVKHNIRHKVPMKIKPEVMPKAIRKEIKALDDSLVLKRFELEQMTAGIQHLNGEKTMIQNNKLMTGGGKSDSLPVLKDAIDYYRKKLEEIEKRLLSEKLKQHRMQATESRMRNRLKELRNYNQNVGQPTQEIKDIHQVIVTIHADKALKGKLQVSYLVNLAGWYPSYDLRADEKGGPMNITYKASVFQETGMDWEDVHLTLSTYNQNCFTSKPSMPTWLLDYYVYQKQTPISSMAYSNFKKQVQQQRAYENDRSRQLNTPTQPQSNMVMPTNSGYTSFADTALQINMDQRTQLGSIQQSFSNVEFKISHDYSINSDGEQVLMLIHEKSVPATYNHFVLPKVNPDAFLMANVSDWESLNLLPAQANIYYGQTFVGQTSIDPVSIKDTMEIAMGRDRGIITTRKKTKDEEKTSGLSKRKTRTITIEVIVKNTKDTPVTLQIEDQYPISKNEDIEVTLTKKSRAKVNDSNGALTWTMELQPKQTEKIEFTYVIEYDKHKTLLP